MLLTVEWWARHERMAEDGDRPWYSFIVMAGLVPAMTIGRTPHLTEAGSPAQGR